MSAEIKVTLDQAEAERQLDELDKGLEGARKEADKLDKSTSKRAKARRKTSPKKTSGGGVGGTVAKGLAVATAAIVVAKVVEALIEALGRELERLGLGDAGQTLQGLAVEITEITSTISKLQAAVGGAVSAADPFVSAGLLGDAEAAAWAGARAAAARAGQESHLSRRKRSRGAVAYGKAGLEIAKRVMNGQGL